MHFESRRRDFVRLAASLVVQRPAEPHGRADVARRRHAVGEPELQHVLGRRRVADQAVQRDGKVRVRIDETRHDVHARRIDHPGARIIAAGHGQPGGAAGLEIGNPVAFDDDVDGPVRRRAGAIDDRGAANDQLVVRPGAFSLGAIRRSGRGWDAGRDQRCDEFLAGLDGLCVA